jgi:hypothetical protein
MALRLAFDSFSALAFPPLSPPSRPSATAAGFLSWPGAGCGFPVLGASPVAWRKARAAIRIGSVGSSRAGRRDAILERFGMPEAYHGRLDS